MSDEQEKLPEPTWGDPPQGSKLGALLRSRHLGKAGGVGPLVTVTDEGLALSYERDGSHYQVRIDYLRGARERDPWTLLVDALDELFGAFVESEFDYRRLPTGSDVMFRDAYFRVSVTHDVPELSKLADEILAQGDPS